MGRDYGGDGAVQRPLLEEETGPYVCRRQPQDRAWFYGWLSILLVSCVGGAFAIFHRNTAFAQLISHDSMHNPATCPMPKANGRDLLEEVADNRGDPIQLDDFMRQAFVWIIGAITLAFVVGASFLLLVRYHARVLVFVAIFLQIMLPTGLAVASFMTGNIPAGVTCAVLSGLLFFTFFLFKSQINLVTRLLGVAGHGLVDNSGLIVAAILIQLVSVLMLVPLALSGVAAIMNGQVMYNYDRNPDLPAQCVDVTGKDIPCCVWQVDAWVPYFLIVAFIAILWTTFLAFEIRTFTVSGAVSAWYFEPVSSQGSAPSRTLRALGHAVGPSLGSLCLGSAVLTTMSLLRQALDGLKSKAEENVFVWCLVAALNFLCSFIEYATKFATVRIAITGEAFFQGGKAVVDLLMRNFLDAYGVWWLPPMILHSCALVVSASTALGMYGTSFAVWSHNPAILQAPQYAMLLAIISFAACWAVLSFFCSLLLNIVDAVFVCYAMDLDLQSCTMIEVHEVYSLLPAKKVGPLVENPGGDVYYGAPSSQDAPNRT